MADTPKLVSSMGRAELDRIFVRGYFESHPGLFAV